ncbi:MAG TPA: 30S ribosome-binding factor RbfA [Fermentimonas caenicola]|jgi:ribosome-binding factor A|uniref:Ribosome-binding factor A n=1 Tax=Fermentimonas caenicola TaxID=1562970 RepID=A0A098BZJ1_9BACT|nr:MULTISPECIES: 30S ribosome-binding factor RbfA [Lascolabacillus]MBP6176222.1 30S ribosome-binding factor RbfA [Fermentimonas sp.]MDI9625378.1 30S ribosome-binding factor RbfA [Bacteroidota bacterium]TAH60836.1 MAG: 30S ribosome-binding factor RbfA [Fermentimonas caenicola]MBP6196985.1 30S ribosome-binding factor RbfA [Fermentimonas sp.]MBP7104653.1 30S ribosome-binding factor RbfA [Fermentimonas sp.]
MDSNRQQKINRLIQKELSELFLLETKKMQGVLISVTNVRVSPDLSVAHAYLSIFPSDKGEELVKNINENVKSVRYDLGKRLRNQLRVIPELTFHVDDSLDYVENIDRLLKND